MFCLYWRCIDRHSNIWLSYKVCSRSTEHTGASWKERLDSAWHFLHLTWCPCPFSAHLQVHPSRFANTSFCFGLFIIQSAANLCWTLPTFCVPKYVAAVHLADLVCLLRFAAGPVAGPAEWLAPDPSDRLAPFTTLRHCNRACRSAVTALATKQ